MSNYGDIYVKFFEDEEFKSYQYKGILVWDFYYQQAKQRTENNFLCDEWSTVPGSNESQCKNHAFYHTKRFKAKIRLFNKYMLKNKDNFKGKIYKRFFEPKL